MPKARPFPITPPPGVVKTEADSVALGRWTAAQAARFVRGRIQKIGGWEKQTAEATSGAPRAIHGWRGSDFVNYAAVGTYRKLYAYDPEWTLNDITPLAETGTLTDPFTTTDGSSIVSVADSAHGRLAGDMVIFDGADAVGGLMINGPYTVLTVTNANAYTIDAGSNASSGATGGGSVDYEYEVSSGTEFGSLGLGWGVGGWGLGTWGTARPGSSIVIEPRVWSLDNYFSVLLAAFNGGSIYEFDPAGGVFDRAEVIADAPDDVRFIFVTPEAFVVALREDMTVAWCSQGDYTVWTPATSNTAGSRTLGYGNKLVGGRVLGQYVSLIWSDAGLFSMTWNGSKYIFATRLIARDCGLLGPGAAVTINGIAYWMGQNNFLMYDGSVRPMPNVEDIRSFVYDDLRREYAYQCHAVLNPRFNEVWFFYTPTGGTAPTKCVIYSINDQCWTPFTVTRCSGARFTTEDSPIYMTGNDGHVYLHETGVDDDGASLPWSATLAPYALEDGDRAMDIDGFRFDAKGQVGDIAVALTAWDELRDTDTMDSETETFGPTDSHMDFRASGRYLGLTLSGEGVGCTFRLGKPVAFIKPGAER
jgi:hypothetical protein